MPRPENTYLVHDIFGPTIQGEASMAGVPVIFLRLSLCNMWDGRQETRAQSGCPFCDTEFNGRTPMSAEEITDRIETLAMNDIRWVWISGGEPTIQVDSRLLAALHRRFFIGMETNGTMLIPGHLRSLISHLVVSPKRPREYTKQTSGETLKLLYPHPNLEITPEAFGPGTTRFDQRYLQPVWDEDESIREANLRAAISRITGDLARDKWRLSLQTHKYIGVE